MRQKRERTRRSGARGCAQHASQPASDGEEMTRQVIGAEAQAGADAGMHGGVAARGFLSAATADANTRGPMFGSRSLGERGTGVSGRRPP